MSTDDYIRFLLTTGGLGASMVFGSLLGHLSFFRKMQRERDNYHKMFIEELKRNEAFYGDIKRVCDGETVDLSKHAPVKQEALVRIAQALI